MFTEEQTKRESAWRYAWGFGLGSCALVAAACQQFDLGELTGPRSALDGKPLDVNKMKQIRADEGCGLWTKDGDNVKAMRLERRSLEFALARVTPRKSSRSPGNGRELRTSLKLSFMDDTVHLECWLPETVTMSDLVGSLSAEAPWRRLYKKLAEQPTLPAAVLSRQLSREAEELRYEMLSNAPGELRVSPAAKGANYDYDVICGDNRVRITRKSKRPNLDQIQECDCFQWGGNGSGEFYCVVTFVNVPLPARFYFSNPFSGWWIDQSGGTCIGNCDGGTENLDDPEAPLLVITPGNASDVLPGQTVTFTVGTNRPIDHWEWSQGYSDGTYSPPQSDLCGKQVSCQVIAYGPGRMMVFHGAVDGGRSATATLTMYAGCSSEMEGTNYPDPGIHWQMGDGDSVGTFDKVLFAVRLANEANKNRDDATGAPKATGFCATYIRQVLCESGLKPACKGQFSPAWYPGSAKDYGTAGFLTRMGFQVVATSTSAGTSYTSAYSPQVGDIAVFDYGTDGHVSAYIGSNAFDAERLWASDFLQLTVFPRSDVPRPHVIYRRP